MPGRARLDVLPPTLLHLGVPTRPDAAPRGEHENVDLTAAALVDDPSEVVHHCRGRRFHRHRRRPAR